MDASSYCSEPSSYDVVVYERALETEGESSTLRRSVADDSVENWDSISELAGGLSAPAI